MARPMRAASTSHRRAWASCRVHVVGQDRAVVVEAVEAGGQAADPGGDLGRGPVDGRVGHHLGQLLEAADELELALVGEEREVDLGQRAPRHAALEQPCGRRRRSGHWPSARRRPGSPSTARVTEARSKVVAWSREVIRLRMRVASGPMSATSESRRDGVAGPLAHLHRLVAVDQRDHLAELDLEAARVDAQRLDAGRQAGHLAVVVGAEDVDHPVEAADEELVAVVGEVAGQVGGVAVRLAQHPVAAVAELGGPEPGRAVLLEDQPLGRPAGRSSRRPRRSPRSRPGCTTRRRRCPTEASVARM